MSTTKKMAINKDNLYAEFKKRDIRPAKVSEQLGYSKWYLSNSASRGYLSLVCIRALEREYGIKPENYVCIEEKVEEKVTPPVVDFDYEKLSSVIYEAVYTAVKRAWEND